MEHLLQKSKCSIFHNIFIYMIFRRRQKALLWSKGFISLVKTILCAPWNEIFSRPACCGLNEHDAMYGVRNVEQVQNTINST